MEGCFWDLLEETENWPFMEYWDMLLEALASELRDAPFDDPLDDWLSMMLVVSRAMAYLTLLYIYMPLGRLIVLICLYFNFGRYRQIYEPDTNTPVPEEEYEPEGLLDCFKAIWCFIKAFVSVLSPRN